VFGSEIVSTVTYAQLVALPGVIAGFAGKVVGLPVLPQAVALPGIAFYPEFSAYTGAIGARTDYEQMRWAIKAMCAGTSTAPITAIANEMLEHFDDLTVDVTYNGANYQVTFSANSEVLPTTVVDGSTFYRQLGTVCNVDIT
jgi:hypothetical protein